MNYHQRAPALVLLFFVDVLAYCQMLETGFFSTGTIAESQNDFDLATPQIIPTDKPLQIITFKNSSANTIEESKETFVHVINRSLKGNISSSENQLKNKQKIIDGLFNLHSCQCSCNYANRNYQEEKLGKLKLGDYLNQLMTLLKQIFQLTIMKTL